jgi:hypothetical protein
MGVRDLKGQTFDRLAVLEEAGVRDSKMYWLCQCDCGNRVTVRGTRLTQGRTVSCGCYRADPAIRSAARMQIPARRRKQIARMGGAAYRAIRAGDQQD